MEVSVTIMPPLTLMSPLRGLTSFTLSGFVTIMSPLRGLTRFTLSVTIIVTPSGFDLLYTFRFRYHYVTPSGFG